MLEVARRHCECCGRLWIAPLIVEHGAGVLDLRAVRQRVQQSQVNLMRFNSFSLTITEQTRLDFNSLNIVLVD
jgi:hypothetical protein